MRSLVKRLGMGLPNNLLPEFPEILWGHSHRQWRVIRQSLRAVSPHMYIRWFGGTLDREMYELPLGFFLNGHLNVVKTSLA